MTQHLNLAWNPATNEWFCTTCGRTSANTLEHDARLELTQYDCRLPSIEVSSPAPGTETIRLMKKSYKTAPKPTGEL